MRGRGLGGQVVVGIVAGGLSGLFGVGGGILIVPGLVLLLRFTQRRAHGTSLAAILPIAAGGIAGYAREIAWLAAALLSLGAVVGAWIGVRQLVRVPERPLRLGFAAFTLLAAVALFWQIHPEAPKALDAARGVGLVGVGLASGVLAGLLGVGGGIVIVPAMVILLGVPDLVAKGTSLAVIIPTALTGTARNLRQDTVDVRVAAVVGIAGAAAAFATSFLSLALDPRLSSALFAVLLVAIGLDLAVRRVRP